MATTTGLWMWGWRVTTSNQNLPFDRGGNRDAVLRLGTYTAGQFADEVERAMIAADPAGSAPYTCDFNFDTRKFTIDNGATAIALEFTRNASNCAGLLGFAPGSDTASIATGHTGDAAGDGEAVDFSFVWAPAEPAVFNTPVAAGTDGSTAQYLQRKARTVQNETDGGLRETIYFSTDKLFRIEYRYLRLSGATNEQALFESLLGWLETGAPVDFRPDDTAASTINMRLVLTNPGESRNTFSWPTRTEVDYPALELVQQLSRT